MHTKESTREHLLLLLYLYNCAEVSATGHIVDMSRSTSKIWNNDVKIDEVAGYNLSLPDAHHLFPVHSACTEMAETFFSSYASNRLNLPSRCRADGNLIRSWADLYLAFETQFEIESNRRPPSGSVFRLQWENQSHGAAAFQHVVTDTVPADPCKGEPEHLVWFRKGWKRVPESKYVCLT